MRLLASLGILVKGLATSWQALETLSARTGYFSAFFFYRTTAPPMCKRKHIIYILFLAVYGVDSILTIIHRLTKKEDIFEAHRSHLYQWLVKPGPFSHLQMAMFYGLSQLLINVLVIQSANASLIFQLSISSAIIIVLVIVYIVLN